MKLQEALIYILSEEGGYVNHPKDPGGVTNLGVTRRAYEDWKGGSVSEKEMRELTPEKVAPFYQRQYWNKCRCGDLHPGVDLIVFDCAVNQGVGAASKILQKSVGAKIDGVIGPKTIAMATAQSSRPTVEYIAFLRALRYMQTRNIETFGRGWAARISHIRDVAIVEENHTV